VSLVAVLCGGGDLLEQAREKLIFPLWRRIFGFRHHWHVSLPMRAAVCCLVHSTSLDSIVTHIPLYFFFSLRRKDAKKVSKLEAQIPYHEGRGNQEEVAKIKEQIEAIWEKARESVLAM
jgi:hypothetical protein